MTFKKKSLRKKRERRNIPNALFYFFLFLVWIFFFCGSLVQRVHGGAEEFFRIGIVRGRHVFLGFEELDEFAAVEDRHAIAEVFDDIEIVRDKDIGEIVFRLQFLEKI